METRLCARLLGIRLLVIDGVVTLWPAQRHQPDPDLVLPVSWPDVERRPPALPAAADPAAGPTADGALGSRLEATALRLETSTRRLRDLRAAGDRD